MAGYERELETAARLAREASDVILKIYATDFSVASKGKAGPVTEADLQASAIIVDGLRREFPEDAVVSEEESASHGQPGGPRIWYVDPLDGTREFISRNGEFAVMIGLAVDGRAAAGIVYQPVTGMLFTGVSEREAWLEHDGQRTRLRVSKNTELGALRLAVSRSHRHSLVTELKTRIGVMEETPCGSVGLKVGLIAMDRADLYLDPSPYTQAWDACGPEAVLLGAGGRLTDLAGAPITYGTAELRNRRGLLATNGACHRMVLDAITPLLKQAGIV